ncbi:ABC transporter ATP-binding protein [Ornithinibacillus sp. JPR2-1]|uniref:ABC transporter ATP-binding protein n=1 Tax=Ornithinibacillus sp. JPR2-1 TaxID=2094019 RepID=UPI0031DB12B1
MRPIIEVEKLWKTYQKRKSSDVITAVDDISFSIYEGEIVGLLGPNGAGKSTTIKMICGLIKPDSGKISINGIDNQQKRLKALTHISAVLEGNRNLYWRLTVRENLEYFAGNRGKSRKEVASQIDDLLKKFHLKQKEHELVNRLSRGMQQKLAIAVAMLADTEIILLDEPTLGIDVETGYEVRQLLKEIAKEYKRTIIISSHDMDVIQDLCERTIIINNGKIITNDRVENLLRLFEVRAYTITLANHLSEQQQLHLQEKFPQLEYTLDNHQSKIEVNLPNSNAIYELFEILNLEKTPIETIDRKTINFEEVFLKIIKGESEHELVQSY